MSSHYSTYGLGLNTNLAIPGLVDLPAIPQVDVLVRLRAVPSWLNSMWKASALEWYSAPCQKEGSEPSLTVCTLDSSAYFRFLYRDGTQFIIDRAGARVWANWPDSLALEDTTTYLLGPILGFVLRLRRVTCLHASAVAIGDEAIVFVGTSGAGKSTTAAAFAERGYPVLCDDLAALSEQEYTFFVQPGYPLLRLWPSTMDTLYGPMDTLPRLTPTWDKRYLDLTQNGYRFQQEPLPLAAIYILDERRPEPSAPFIQSVRAREGLMALVPNTNVNYLLDKAMRAHEFELLGRVVANVPLRRVTSHTDPAHLSTLCDLILDDFGRLTQSSHFSTGTVQA